MAMAAVWNSFRENANTAVTLRNIRLAKVKIKGGAPGSPVGHEMVRLLDDFCRGPDDDAARPGAHAR